MAELTEALRAQTTKWGLEQQQQHPPAMCWLREQQQCADCTALSLKGTHSLMMGEKAKTEGDK